MNNRIRRLSFGLAVMICLQGFVVGMAEEPLPQEPQPTVQPQTTPAPIAEPEPVKTPENTATQAPKQDNTPVATQNNQSENTPTETLEQEASAASTVEATKEATAEPSVEATKEAAAEPSVEATKEAAAAPSVEATKEAAAAPSVEATKEATAAPSAEATKEAAVVPSIHPTIESTINPTNTPSLETSNEPSNTPSMEPSNEPSNMPSMEPSVEPSVAPEDMDAPVLHRFARTPEGDVVLETVIRFEAEVSDAVSLQKVQIFVDGVLAGEREYQTACDEHITFTYETAALEVGEHYAYVLAVDAAGNTASSDQMKICVLDAQNSLAPPLEGSPAPICSFVEHSHGESCFDEQGVLICELTEHTHDASCYPMETPAPEDEDQAAEDVSNEDGISVESRVDWMLWKGVKPSDERGMAIPVLYQRDYPETVCTIRGLARSVASSGCGATSLSMVIAYLTGDTQQNPYTLFCDAVDAGRYHGAGWSHDTLTHYARKYGVQSKWISNDAGAILQALREGKPIIAHMGPGIFTSRGHYLVLRGVTEDGLVLMNDPNSKNNCERAFPIENLIRQAKTSTAFMICWTEEAGENEADGNGASENAQNSLWGDINGSGELDINDAQLMYEMINAGSADATYDLNSDGVVDQKDMDLLVNKILDPQLPVEVAPAAEPTMEAPAEPTLEVTVESTPTPTAEPTPEVTMEPTPAPTAESAAEAANQPIPETEETVQESNSKKKDIEGGVDA